MSPLVTMPSVTVDLDGRTLPAAERHALVQLEVHQVLNVPARAEVTFADPPGPLPSDPPTGAGLVIRVAEGSVLFEGDVSAVEHRYERGHDHRMVVRAYDGLDRMRREPRSEVHADVSLVDLADRLGREVGLEVASTETTPTMRRVLQCQRSDLDLLRELAERIGVYLAVHGRTLHLLALSGTGEELPLTLGSELLSATIERRPGLRRVRVHGWDPVAAAGLTGAAEGARRASGSADTDRTPLDRWLSGLVLRDGAHAAAVAQAELDRHAAGAVTLAGEAEGTPRLRPGVPVAVSGLDDSHVGTYVVACATHRLDNRDGYLTSFDTRPPRRTSWNERLTLMLGIVAGVDDPDDLGRVRVALPAFDDLETGWIGVASPGAGPGRGLVAVPDVGDRVVVLAPRHDPALGIVLGGLYGDEPPPDAGVVADRVRRISVSTPEGIRVTLADDEDTLSLENGAGSRLDLGPEGISVHSEGELELAAPGQRVVIRGAKIDFERA